MALTCCSGLPLTVSSPLSPGCACSICLIVSGERPRGSNVCCWPGCCLLSAAGSFCTGRSYA